MHLKYVQLGMLGLGSSRWLKFLLQYNALDMASNHDRGVIYAVELLFGGNNYSYFFVRQEFKECIIQQGLVKNV